MAATVGKRKLLRLDWQWPGSSNNFEIAADSELKGALKKHSYGMKSRGSGSCLGAELETMEVADAAAADVVVVALVMDRSIVDGNNLMNRSVQSTNSSS